MLELKFATAMSMRLSASKSAVAIAVAAWLVRIGELRSLTKPPGVRSSTVTRLPFWFAIARSGRPSELKSAVSTPVGPSPTG